MQLVDSDENQYDIDQDQFISSILTDGPDMIPDLSSNQQLRKRQSHQRVGPPVVPETSTTTPPKKEPQTKIGDNPSETWLYTLSIAALVCCLLLLIISVIIFVTSNRSFSGYSQKDHQDPFEINDFSWTRRYDIHLVVTRGSSNELNEDATLRHALRIANALADNSSSSSSRILITFDVENCEIVVTSQLPKIEVPVRIEGF